MLIDLDEVDREYRATTGQYDLRVIADHYGIFDDLFGLAYFVPRVALDIQVSLIQHVRSALVNYFGFVVSTG